MVAKEVYCEAKVVATKSYKWKISSQIGEAKDRKKPILYISMWMCLVEEYESTYSYSAWFLDIRISTCC